LPHNSHIRAQSSESNLLATRLLIWEPILGRQTDLVILRTTAFAIAASDIQKSAIKIGSQLIFKMTRRTDDSATERNHIVPISSIQVSVINR
jgi:hypothetical protein